MTELDPRIRTALLSIHPTSQHPAWHGCPTAMGVLRGVRAAVATWRPYPGANNIREIALHIAFCENSVANLLSGKARRLGFKQRKNGWALLLDAVDDAQWAAELAMVKDSHDRLTEAVRNFDPEKMDLPTGPRTRRPAVELIHGVAEHSLYHAAQMEMLKTLASKI